MPPVREEDAFAVLRGEGVRSWRRLVPTSEHPARATLKGARFHLKKRQVVDISLGGVSLALRRRDQRRLQISDTVHIELDLNGMPLILQGKLVHIQIREGWLRNDVSIGLVFDNNLSFNHARPRLARYLIQLAQAERVTAAK